MNVQTSVDKPDRADAKYSKRSGRTYVYTPGSPWSHLKYGLGTLAAIVVPTLIPGATKNGLIMGYVGVLVGVVGIVCVWGMVRSLKPVGERR